MRDRAGAGSASGGPAAPPQHAGQFNPPLSPSQQAGARPHGSPWRLPLRTVVRVRVRAGAVGLCCALLATCLCTRRLGVLTLLHLQLLDERHSARAGARSVRSWAHAPSRCAPLRSSTVVQLCSTVRKKTTEPAFLPAASAELDGGGGAGSRRRAAARGRLGGCASAFGSPEKLRAAATAAAARQGASVRLNRERRKGQAQRVLHTCNPALRTRRNDRAARRAACAN